MARCSSQAAGALPFRGVWGAWEGPPVSDKGCAHLAAPPVCTESVCAPLSLQGTQDQRISDSLGPTRMNGGDKSLGEEGKRRG